MELLSSTGAHPMTKEEIKEFCNFCAKSEDDEMEIDINSIINVLIRHQVDDDEKCKTQINIMPTLYE